MTGHHTVNDVTQLNPVRVMAIVAPQQVEDVQEALRRTTGSVSIGGGRFSMGGQTASCGSLHFDMRSLNRIVSFSPTEKVILVQAGVRWCDIQRFVDPHGLSVKIMQTYANFTVGGSLSVNCHGRYVGLGPMVMSVRAIRVVLHDGSVVEATRTQRPKLFFGAIGGYGALGIVVEIELDLVENKRLQRVDQVMPLTEYLSHFKNQVRSDPKAVFHHADIYGPHYGTVRSVTWVESEAAATTQGCLQRLAQRYPLHQYLLWSVSESPLGGARREMLIDPLLYLRRQVHWRNYEAGYDVAELEPPSRQHQTYVLQEYFIPVQRLEEFVPRLAEILLRHKVNALNISIRHAMPDPDTLLNWAPVETFAFVLYHKQRTRENARRRVAVWTRELIDLVLEFGGTYYLPYQPHATPEQFHRAYPKATELFELKKVVDPDFRFTNALWDKYYRPWLAGPVATLPTRHPSDFHRVFGDVHLSDAFYRFLQNVFCTAPEDRFHHLIAQACELHRDEESIYRHIQSRLGTIKPPLADLTYALPALRKQKAEMTAQTLKVLGNRRQFNGYLEIGSKGRYFPGLAGALELSGPTHFVDERPPGYSPVDMLERGQVSKRGTHHALEGYAPLALEIDSASVDLVTCYVGLHHMRVDQLGPFLASVQRVLRPGGVFVVRDHDVTTPEMRTLVSLAHTVFNAGLGETWETNSSELRHFESIQVWVDRLNASGFIDTGHRIRQDNDPTRNTLLSFTNKTYRSEPIIIKQPIKKRQCHANPGRRLGAIARSMVATVALLATTVTSFGAQSLAPAEHRRNPEQTFLTFPEWYLVHSPAEYADYLQETRHPSRFPLFAHIGQFWQAYGVVIDETRRYPFNVGYHLMISVIGTSTTVEYAMKGLYEHTIGRLSEATRTSSDAAPEERFAAKAAQDYVDFIRVDPWYLFDFQSRLTSLWKLPMSGPNSIRRLERRFALSSEYLVKEAYARLIKFATRSIYEAPKPVTAIVLDRMPSQSGTYPEFNMLGVVGDEVVATIPRYDAFTDYSRWLADQGVSFLEIAGNRGEVVVSLLTPIGYISPTPSARVLFSQPMLTQANRQRVVLVVPITRLGDQMRQESGAVRIEHVYDF